MNMKTSRRVTGDMRHNAAAMKGSSHVISGAANKLQAAGSHLLSPDALAEQHRKMAEPGTAE